MFEWTKPQLSPLIYAKCLPPQSYVSLHAYVTADYTGAEGLSLCAFFYCVPGDARQSDTVTQEEAT